MSDPIFGIVFNIIDETGNPVIGADLSTIGLIGPAPLADPDVFPINVPVAVASNDTVTLPSLGTAGYLPDAIQGINDQLGDLQQAAQLVIVVTAPGTDPDPATAAMQTIGGIMGSSLNGTGIWAFLGAPDLVAMTPRIICAPGYTGIMATSLNTIQVDTIGSGYIPGTSYPITFAGGGDPSIVVLPEAHAVADPAGEIHQEDVVIDGYGAFFTAPVTGTLPGPPLPVTATLTTAIAAGVLTGLILGVAGGGYVPGETYPITFTLVGGGTLPTGHAVADATGAITTAGLFIDTPGASLTAPPTAAVPAPPASAHALVTVTTAPGANPVCAALMPVLNSLLAQAVIEPPGVSTVGDEAWRSTLQGDRLIAVAGGAKILDPVAGEVVVVPLAPRVAGVLVRRDFETGAPFHSAANQPIQGIVGPARSIAFSLVDGSNEGQNLLSNNIGILVRGETGNDFAIASGGFVFIGTDNLGEDPLWQFYNVKRGRDYIHLSLLKALRYYLGRYNITGQTVQALLNTMTGFLSVLKAGDNILGYNVGFQGSFNTADQIRLGNVTITFAAEEPPVLRKITVNSARYRAAIDAMIGQLETQLNIAA